MTDNNRCVWLRESVGEVAWLSIERDAESGGWFLFGFANLGQPCLFDSWHETREAACLQAAADWGVPSSEWS
tara:strand:- start:824 stop:1039 length:216 start_codon:yes stop_codon:yes gene_type:complete